MKIPKFITDWYSSLFNNKDGMSARKLTAFATMAMIVYLHIQFVDKDNVVDVIFWDQIFVLLLLGIVTAANLVELRTGQQQPGKDAKD